MTGLVSTVIPVHNRSTLLREAVSSVLAQTYRPIEIVIVDDGSQDDTGVVADELAAAHPEVRALHQANSGVGLARETGRKVAAGEFIQYLDSDDILLPRKFEWQVRGLDSNLDCGVAYGKTHYGAYGGQSDPRPWKLTGERIEWMFPSFLRLRWWGTSTPLYRRTVTDAAGPWVGLNNEEDWEYDCRIAAMGTRLFYVPEFVSTEREHSGTRLSRSGSRNVESLRHRARAHALIFGHAREAGISGDTPEMQHFARELFLLSRQCGAAGLGTESRDLFFLAKEASGSTRGNGLDFKLYSIVAGMLGWTLAGYLACTSDRLRK